MNTKHTPGPWRVERNSRNEVLVYGNVQGGPVAMIEELDNTGGTPQDHANARLIASAPRLKDALWSLIGTIPDGCAGGEFLEAMNALQSAQGLPEFKSFDAARATSKNVPA